MCATCGCSGAEAVGEKAHEHGREHSHGQGHPHAHPHRHREPSPPVDRPPNLIRLERDVLARNNELAELNRRRLSADRIFALNLMSSPGAGKTTLLERTLREVGTAWPIQVIEGDQETDHDTRRLQAAGGRAVQINTGTGCHLDASMVERGLRLLAPVPRSLVVIENVGNLVCPALFDLGEHSRVLVSAVTEGEEKPVKYPHMFRAATLVLLNKIDLLPYVPFELDRFREYVRQVSPRLPVFPVSATRGDGMGDWYGWLRGQAAHAAE